MLTKKLNESKDHGKRKNPRRVADNEAMAKLRMLKTSPQKLNLLAGLIRGKKVDRALNDLTFSKKELRPMLKSVFSQQSLTLKITII